MQPLLQESWSSCGVTQQRSLKRLALTMQLPGTVFEEGEGFSTLKHRLDTDLVVTAV